MSDDEQRLQMVRGFSSGVPHNQALAVYNIYKAKGVDARLVYFPDENHWVLKPRNSLVWNREVHDWLERYLKK